MLDQVLVVFVQKCLQALKFTLMRGCQFALTHWVAPQHITYLINAITDLGQAIIKQVHLQHARLEQTLNLRLGNGRNI